MISPKVLLLRNPSQDSPDRYHEHLESLGFIPYSIPVLDTVLVGLDNMEETLLNKSADYDGVVVTSSRAAEAWRTVATKLLHVANPRVEWSSVPFYVVGSATSNALKSIPPSPFTPSAANIQGYDSGSGDSLARFIVDDLSGSGNEAKKLLYLTGDKNRDTLPNILKQAGVELTNAKVYETCGSSSFGDNLKILIGKESPFDSSEWWIVFFAPSSAEFVVPFLREHFKLSSNNSESSLLSVKVASIGPTTSSYLAEHLNIRVDVTSVKPTPEALGSAIFK